MFGAAVAIANPGSRIFQYGADSREIQPGKSVLLTMKDLLDNKVDHATNTWPSVQTQYAGEDRLVIFTDMQDHPSDAKCPKDVKTAYVWDLSGYGKSNIQVDSGRFLLGGWSDSAFTIMNSLETVQKAQWPWEGK